MPFIDLSSPGQQNKNQAQNNQTSVQVQEKPEVDNQNNQQNDLNNNDQNNSNANSLPTNDKVAQNKTDQTTEGNINQEFQSEIKSAVEEQTQDIDSNSNQNESENADTVASNNKDNVNENVQKTELPNMIETKGPPLPEQSQGASQQNNNKSIPGSNGLPPLNSVLGNDNQNSNGEQSNNTGTNGLPPMPSNGNNTQQTNQNTQNQSNNQNPTNNVNQQNKGKTNYARIISNFNPQNASMKEFMGYAIGSNASDLHISGDDKSYIRVDGVLRQIQGGIVPNDRVGQLVDEILDKKQKEKFLAEREYDLSHEHPDGDRFRVNVFFKKGRYSMALRLIPRKIKTISELGLPNILYEFTNFPQGLVVVTGPTGSGKSTTIASMIQEINMNRSEHIITIEDPVEYVYPKMRSLVEQRELGSDTLSWTNALKSALRQAPDIVLVGEMRDFNTIESTITVAETGHLVFATLHTNSAAQTIDRIIDVFPEGQQNQVRAQLANVINAVVAQRLVKIKSGGRKAVMEIMIATPAVKNSIREGKTYQIDNILQTGSDIGMQTMESSLVKLVKAGEITAEEAKQYTLKTDELMTLLKS